MFEFLKFPRLCGVVPFGPSKCKEERWTESPVLVSCNVGVISFVAIIYSYLLSFSYVSYKFGHIAFIIDHIIIGASCMITLISLLLKRKFFCELVNRIILTRHRLSSKTFSTDSVPYVYFVPIILICVAVVLFNVVEKELALQPFILSFLAFYLYLSTLVFLGITREVLKTLSAVDEQINRVGRMNGTRLRQLRSIHLRYIHELRKINTYFSVTNFLKPANVLGQCVIAINYIMMTPPDQRLLMIVCMFFWCSFFFFDFFLTIIGCWEPTRKVW